MLNPLDEDATQIRTAERLKKEIYLADDALEAKAQMHLFRVHQDQELLHAIQESESLGRVPLLIRSARCGLEKSEIFDRVKNVLSLDEEVYQEIDMRKFHLASKGQESVIKQE